MAIPDRGVPDSRRAAATLLTQIYGLLIAGRTVAIHCRQGIGRSGLMAGCLLVLGGETAGDAIAKVSRDRGREVPETAEQRKWLFDFGSSAKKVLSQKITTDFTDGTDTD